MKKQLQLRQHLAILLWFFTLATHSQGFGSALHFDGQNDYVELNDFARPDNFTVEFWIYNERVIEDQNFSILSWVGNADFVSWILTSQNHVFYVARGGDGHTDVRQIGFPLPSNEWHHVAVVKDGENIHLYIDGNIKGQIISNSNEVSNSNSTVILGATNAGNPIISEFFGGALDELRVWNYPKTADEIQIQINKELMGNEYNYNKLVAYFKFNEGDAGTDNTSITTLINEVGSNNNTLENFSLADNTNTSNFIESLAGSDVVDLQLDVNNDNALDFDGDNDYVDLEHFEVPDEFTVEFWMHDKTTSSLVTSTRRHVVSWLKDGNGGIGTGTEIILETNNSGNLTDLIYAAWSSDDPHYRYVGSPITTDNKWHHVAVVRAKNGSTGLPNANDQGYDITLYFDGEQIGKGTANYTEDKTDKLRIGSWAGGLGNDFYGSLDELRVWNYARTQEDIQGQMHSKALNNETGLLAYYPFNHGIANEDNTGKILLLDYSGNDYHGNLANFSLIDTGTSNWVDGVDVTKVENGAFITTWQVKDGESITIPIRINNTNTNTNISNSDIYNYNFTVEWGDGSTTDFVTNNSSNTDLTHEYTNAGAYTVTITGRFPAIYFNDSGDKDKIRTVEQWGNIQWLSMQNAFSGCSNFDVYAHDAPNLDQVTQMWGMFFGATKFTGQQTNMNSWGVSNVQKFSRIFSGTRFNTSIGNWNLQSLDDANIHNMFQGANSLDCSNGTAIIEGWGNNPNIASGAFVLNVRDYAASAAIAISNLEAKGWTINGTEISECPTLSTDNNEVFSNAIKVTNPVTNVLTINGPAGFELKEATLYNILGKQILSTTNTTVNTSKLSSGMYILKIRNKEGLTATKKIIKQ